jgi:hypothetical protein
MIPIGRDFFFELKTSKAPGESAEAYPLEFDAGWSPNEEVYVTVYDSFDAFRGRAKDAFASPNDQGSRGIARWNTQSQRLEIVRLWGQAQDIRGTVVDAVGESDTSFRLENLAVMGPAGHHITDQDPAGDSGGDGIVVNRDFTGAIDSGADAYAHWDESEDTWKAYPWGCPA